MISPTGTGNAGIVWFCSPLVAKDDDYFILYALPSVTGLLRDGCLLHLPIDCLGYSWGGAIYLFACFSVLSLYILTTTPQSYILLTDLLPCYRLSLNSISVSVLVQ